MSDIDIDSDIDGDIDSDILILIVMLIVAKQLLYVTSTIKPWANPYNLI